VDLDQYRHPARKRHLLMHAISRAGVCDHDQLRTCMQHVLAAQQARGVFTSRAPYTVGG
jgi:hypothetical protein